MDAVGRAVRLPRVGDEAAAVTLRALPGVAAPAWAFTLLRAVCKAEGVRRPTLLWTDAPSVNDAAAWVNGEILRVTAPRRPSAVAHRLILHEIAHLTAGIPHGHATRWASEHQRLLATYPYGTG